MNLKGKTVASHDTKVYKEKVIDLTRDGLEKENDSEYESFVSKLGKEGKSKVYDKVIEYLRAKEKKMKDIEVYTEIKMIVRNTVTKLKGMDKNIAMFFDIIIGTLIFAASHFIIRNKQREGDWIKFLFSLYNNDNKLCKELLLEFLIRLSKIKKNTVFSSIHAYTKLYEPILLFFIKINNLDVKTLIRKSFLETVKDDLQNVDTSNYKDFSSSIDRFLNKEKNDIDKEDLKGLNDWLNGIRVFCEKMQKVDSSLHNEIIDIEEIIELEDHISKEKEDEHIEKTNSAFRSVLMHESDSEDDYECPYEGKSIKELRKILPPYWYKSKKQKVTMFRNMNKKYYKSLKRIKPDKTDTKRVNLIETTPETLIFCKKEKIK